MFTKKSRQDAGFFCLLKTVALGRPIVHVCCAAAWPLWDKQCDGCATPSHLLAQSRQQWHGAENPKSLNSPR